MVSRSTILYREFMRRSVIYNGEGCEGYLRIDYGERPRHAEGLRGVMVDIGFSKMMGGFSVDSVRDYASYVAQAVGEYGGCCRVVFVIPDNWDFRRNTKLARAMLTGLRGLVSQGDLDPARAVPILVVHTAIDVPGGLEALIDLANEYKSLFGTAYLGFSMRVNPTLVSGVVKPIQCVRDPNHCVSRFLNYVMAVREVGGDWPWFLLGVNRRVLKPLSRLGPPIGIQGVVGDTDNSGLVPNNLVRRIMNALAAKAGREVRGRGFFKTTIIDRCLVFHVWKYNELPEELIRKFGIDPITDYF